MLHESAHVPKRVAANGAPIPPVLRGYRANRPEAPSVAGPRNLLDVSDINSRGASAGLEMVNQFVEGAMHCKAARTLDSLRREDLCNMLQGCRRQLG